MNKIFPIIESKLLPIAEKMAVNKHLNAVKDGFVFVMPFIIISSFLLLILNLPFTDKSTPFYLEFYANFVAKYGSILMQPYYVGSGVMALFVAYGIGYSLSNSYSLSAIRGGLLSLYAFLIVSAKYSVVPLLEDVSKKFFLEENSKVAMLDARFLNAKGLFIAIIAAFISVEIYRFLVNKKLYISLPESVPEGVSKSFQSLTPILAVTVIFQAFNIIINHSMSILIPELISKFFEPILHVSDSLPALLLIVILIHLIWFSGIHASVLGPIASTIALSNLAINQAALQAGEAIPKIWAGDFLNSFAHIGGAGSTLGLVIAMIMSKNEHIKSIGKLALVPSIFNINEPILFGLPIVMNPVIAIPFVGVPMLSVIIAYTFSKLNIIGRIVTLVPWTTPTPISVFIATNFSFSAFVLNIFLIFMSYLIYTPFVKIYAKSLDLNK